MTEFSYPVFSCQFVQDPSCITHQSELPCLIKNIWVKWVMTQKWQAADMCPILSYQRITHIELLSLKKHMDFADFSLNRNKVCSFCNISAHPATEEPKEISTVRLIQKNADPEQSQREFWRILSKTDLNKIQLQLNSNNEVPLKFWIRIVWECRSQCYTW